MAPEPIVVLRIEAFKMWINLPPGAAAGSPDVAVLIIRCRGELSQLEGVDFILAVA